MVKKILLIQPTIYSDFGQIIKRKKLYFIGLTLPLLAAITKKDWEVEICTETIQDIPYDTDASVIGIGSMGHSLRRGIEIADKFRKKQKLVIFGGFMSSLIPKHIKPFCDSVVVGDVENVWDALLTDIENGCLKDFYNKPLKSLSYPFPRYDLLPKYLIGDFLPVQAGRGCPNHCSFCSISCIYKKVYLKREISEVIRDIRGIKKMGFNKFLLIDDNIAANQNYLKKLCREIQKEKMLWMSQCAITVAKNNEMLKSMAASGCTTLSFGLESLNPANLIAMNKSWSNVYEYEHLLNKIHREGIDIATEMMIGMEHDTRESLLETIEFLIRNKIEFPKLYILTPIPGTKFFDEAIKKQIITSNHVNKYSPSFAVIKTTNFTSAELNLIYWEMYEKLYSITNIIKRVILSKRFFKYPIRCMFNVWVNLIYRRDIKQKIAPIII